MSLTFCQPAPSYDTLMSLARRTRRLMMFQSLTMPGDNVHADTFHRPITEREPLLAPGWPKTAFIEHSFAGDPANCWVPNHPGVEAMLRASGLKVLSRPAAEIDVCEPDRSSGAAYWIRCSGFEAALQASRAVGG